MALSGDITGFKKLGLLQTTFMYRVAFEGLPSEVLAYIDDDRTYMTLQTRDITLPEKTRTTQPMRFNNKQVSSPRGTTYDDTFSLDSVLMTEDSLLYKAFCKWYDMVDESETARSVDCIVQLLEIDGVTQSKAFKVTNVYPKTKPVPTGLSQDDDSGHIQYAIQFGCDDVDYDLDNELENPFPSLG